MKPYNLRVILLMAVLLLAACGGGGAAAVDVPTLINVAGANIQAAQSFKIEVRREGAPYYITTELQEIAQILFNRALLQYQAPDTLQGDVRGAVAGVPFNLGVLARGDLQWIQLPGIGWTNQYYFAYGFNPQDLIADGSGFQAALNALLDIELVGTERLEDGTEVYHLRGRASGPAVTDLLVGLIWTDDDVLVDAYINTQTQFPSRMIIAMPGTETAEFPEPTTWIVDVYDYDQPVEITGPTPEATSAEG
ncbi:MAG: hypothetical protein ACOYL5_15305 [Phototrophicaceae bacterium]|jgi:hypothetical protein